MARAAMKLRTVRVDDATWLAAQAAAETNGEALADVIRRALVAYARRPRKG